MKITFKQKGDFRKLTSFFERMKEGIGFGILDKYGKAGVDALSEYTPIDSGETSKSWSYSINQESNGVTITWHNDNINEGYNIAVLLQYGHGTGKGAYVQGVDYINPALTPIFDELANEAWKEVTKA